MLQLRKIKNYPLIVILFALGKINKKNTVIIFFITSALTIFLMSFFFLKKHINSPSNTLINKELKQTSPLFYPQKICLAENFIQHQAPVLFVSDSGHHRIVVVSLDGSIIATIGSGQPGLLDDNFDTAQFNEPHGVLWDAKTHVLYISDTKNHALRKIDFTSKMVSTIAGTGTRGRHHVSTQDNPTKTALSLPVDLAFFPDTSTITFAQAATHQLWLYEIDKKRLRILAGNGREGHKDGEYPYHTLAQPSGITVTGNELYFVDTKSNSLRSLNQRQITTLIGKTSFNPGFIDDTNGTAQLNHPQGIAVSSTGIYIADTANHAIRHFDFQTKILSTLIGNGTAGVTLGSFDQTRLNEPNGLAVHEKKLWIIDTKNHRVVVADLEKKQCISLNIALKK